MAQNVKTFAEVASYTNAGSLGSLRDSHAFLPSCSSCSSCRLAVLCNGSGIEEQRQDEQDWQDEDMEDQGLTETIIGCAMKVHSALGPGFLESVYQRTLLHELQKTGLKVECEKPITVYYDSVLVGGLIL